MLEGGGEKVTAQLYRGSTASLWAIRMYSILIFIQFIPSNARNTAAAKGVYVTMRL